MGVRDRIKKIGLQVRGNSPETQFFAGTETKWGLGIGDFGIDRLRWQILLTSMIGNFVFGARTANVYLCR